MTQEPVDAMRQWLRETWSTARGAAEIKDAVVRDLTDKDASALLGVLEAGGDDEQYAAQLALRMLGGEADLWYDQNEQAHFRIRLPGDDQERLITPVRPLPSEGLIAEAQPASSSAVAELVSALAHRVINVQMRWEVQLRLTTTGYVTAMSVPSDNRAQECKSTRLHDLVG